MEWYFSLALIVGIMIILIMLGMHIAFVLGFLSLVFLLWAKVPMASIVPTIYSTMWCQMISFVFTCVPMYLLMSALIQESGLGTKLFQGLVPWAGKVPAGSAICTVGASAVFGACTGSSIATLATIGKVSIPEMNKQGYQSKLSVGAITGAGALGALIPPSVPLILYAMVAEESVGKLFIAAIVPGIILTILMIFAVQIWVKIDPTIAPKVDFKTSWKERIVALRDISPAFFIIVVVISGIYSGVVTPTEAGALGALIGLALYIFSGNFSWKGLFSALRVGAVTTSYILIICAAALAFGFVLSYLDIAPAISRGIIELPLPGIGILAAIQVFLLILGCIMDVPSLILITTPILLPTVLALGFDKIVYGVLIAINAEAAVITPPVGVNIYVASGIGKPYGITTRDVLVGSVPFLIADIACLALLVAFPQLCKLI